MAHLFQVGAGSGGMPVLDMLCRDARITRVTLVEPDVYKEHNVLRHLFPPAAVGQSKAELARSWLHEMRPELEVEILIGDLCDPRHEERIEAAVAAADIGVCAADNEQAKLHFDLVMRRAAKPWTLGEVLSGGIGGFVHWFVPGGPCYGCVASFLRRSVTADKAPSPDYAQPGGAVHEVRIPASRTSINLIASLHAQVTLQLLGNPGYAPGFTSLLFTLEKVPDVFEEAFRPHRFRVSRSAECLICRPAAETTPPSSEELDAALDQALARLGNE